MRLSIHPVLWIPSHPVFPQDTTFWLTWFLFPKYGILTTVSCLLLNPWFSNPSSGNVGEAQMKRETQASDCRGEEGPGAGRTGCFYSKRSVQVRPKLLLWPRARTKAELVVVPSAPHKSPQNSNSEEHWTLLFI